ncbi:MAG: aminotransferase class I/II-fold pyridoxal phosphate-dependent enzyme [Candidatus Lokiarchaeota archaeon]|nr:aminotransferase class I/II-fold pyridoxal phosphate-dependent enzyme [Candidatus Lokiarchaeota archaeon]MBD3341304.1 aminotransferase class I/II-fold pyridoxal phosphate-dependent enzyme [Candidatus Lokiarchaeota archaeon]
MKNAIPLIASENITSPAVQEACNSDFSHRYAEGWVGERVYAGCKYIDMIEQECMDLAKQYFNCVHADVRPVSGVMANLVMYNAFTSENNGKMCAMPIPKGGHISHAPKYTSSGRPIFGTAGTVRGLDIKYLAFDEENMNIEPDESAKIIREFEPEMILFGASVFLFPHPVKELSDVAKEVDAYVGYDAAHVAGLIGSGYFQDPLREGADAMSLSTHKTLPGPQHGAILSNREDMISKLKSAAFPALFSNHHLHNVAGFAVSLVEMLEFGKDYHKDIIHNAKQFAEALSERGFNVLCEHLGFTESHQIVVDIAEFEKSIGLGGDIERLLESANIIVNRNLLPWDIREGRHYMNPGGLRLGTSEVTRLGMGKNEMEEIAEFFKKLIIDKKKPKKIRQEVSNFRKEFQEVKYCFQTPNKAYEYIKFY